MAHVTCVLQHFLSWTTHEICVFFLVQSLPKQVDEWENKLIGRLILTTSASLILLLFSFDALAFSCILAFLAAVIGD